MSNKKILVIDDEKNIRELFSDFLSWYGYYVMTVENGSEGLRRLKEANFDVVLSDINIPGISGIELMKIVREEKIDVFFVLFTGIDVDIARRISEQQAADGFIEKPFSIRQIIHLIEDLFTRKTSRLPQSP